MPTFKESFFRVFNPDVRTALRRFFENRTDRITARLANDFTDSATLTRLLGLGLLQYDPEDNEYRLDDRLERFLEEMLGAVEVAHADWLAALTDELRHLIEGYQKLADVNKSHAFLRRIVRLLRTCESRAQRHLEEIESAVDIDYRAGSDYEIKLLKLQWHLERTKNYGEGITLLDALLRDSAFFQVQQGIDLITIRSRLIRRCSQVGDALIDVYQRIEEYLNRILRDYRRARKLIRLRGIIERHEHLTSTNMQDLSSRGHGPWFRDFRLRTLLSPGVLDQRPELLERAFARAGMAAQQTKGHRIEIGDYPVDDLPPIIDWQNVFESFSRQQHDLFRYLGEVRVEGRFLTEEERVDGFCSILGNEEWSDTWKGGSFETACVENWEFAVVPSPERTSL